MKKTDTNYKFINRIEEQYETNTKHIKHRTRNLPQTTKVSVHMEFLTPFSQNTASNVTNNSPNQIKFRLNKSNSDLILPL